MIELIKEMNGVKVGETWKVNNDSIVVTGLTSECMGDFLSYISDYGVLGQTRMDSFQNYYIKTHEADGSEVNKWIVPTDEHAGKRIRCRARGYTDGKWFYDKERFFIGLTNGDEKFVTSYNSGKESICWKFCEILEK